ncbi:acyltransferase family protein [Segatella paludivivens]|uniref:acyltransferase family protein n=1 Tax=Segatella paludivivens TaxID=185294 RepID=UPI0003645B9F|nr:acyltransferase [Segatella paludivivens]
MKSNKIAWLSVLQGWAMLLVVLGHIDLNNEIVDPEHPFVNLIHSTIYGFHMPLFMFISGYLFYITKINKEKLYGTTILAKFKRLYIPMIFFTCVALLPKVILPTLMKHPADISWSYFVDVFILYKTNPLSEMWFVVSLFILMLLYPIYKSANHNKVLEYIILVVSIILSVSNIQCKYFQLGQVSYMLFYFYSGILVSKYKWYEYAQNKYVLILSLMLFVVVNVELPIVPIVRNLVGIIFSFSLCQNLCKFFSNLFSSYRNYTYQIFLMGIFFQMGVRYLYLYSEIKYIVPFWLLYVFSIFVGIYIPVLISKGIKKINNSCINLCFGL